MPKTLTHKILEKNLIKGELIPGKEIKIKVNQTLTQDSTGTMVYLQLEKMGIKEIKTDFSVAYIDHNTIQSGFENADDHEFIKSVCKKYGIIYSKPGNGICHQINFERFGKPGNIMIGSDSHTPTGGGLGMIAIGAGGLDVAVAMATGAYTMKMPKVLNVELIGKLPKNVTSKDVILKVLKELTVKGGVGYIIEYSGSGLESLSATDRGTITNMGAELGATTSIFPSDEQTKVFLEKQGRVNDYTPLSSDEGAVYDKKIIIDLSKIEPLVAKPHSPDNIDTVKSLKGLKVDQVAIGSCTNSSYTDLMKVAKILKGNSVHEDVSLVISPGSSNILKMLSENGALGDMIAAGARILEASCGPCIGMGQAPKTDAVSLRTFNRNFKGRCGTKSADVYLVSPETAAISAINGTVTSSLDISTDLSVQLPEKFDVYDHYFIYNKGSKLETPVIMGPNIKPFPESNYLQGEMKASVILKTGDNITTDDIMPSNAKLLPFRSNIPKLSNFAFSTIVEDFKERAEKNDGGIVVGGENYGQGSSREHAALVPLYLGVKAVLAKSFARIHRDNLINVGIIPLEFVNKADYKKIEEMDVISINNLKSDLTGDLIVSIDNKGLEFPVSFVGSEYDKEVLEAGGYLNFSVSNL
ncbi:MAG TPA: aconitate hydratase [Clostridia bacterium]|nr:aconitate hydratase [Clostridia bacterium]